MKVYFDTCSIQRPLDTPTQTRIRLEAEAVLGLLERVEQGGLQLVSSTVLEMESSRNTHTVRREHADQVLSRAESVVLIDAATATGTGVRPSWRTGHGRLASRFSRTGGCSAPATNGCCERRQAWQMCVPLLCHHSL